MAYALKRENRQTGALLIEASPGALTPDVRAVIEVLAGQIAIAIEDWRLVEENVRLERKLAEGERLAALGQMAATVAHEVKNPLSAIKSIAQVMSEDEATQGSTRARPEPNRGRNRSPEQERHAVAQLCRKTAARQRTPSSAAEITRSVVGLFRADAEERDITLSSASAPDVLLDGVANRGGARCAFQFTSECVASHARVAAR